MKRSHLLNRRTVLRGLGTAIALPWMECMLPAPGLATASTRLGGASQAAPLRMAFLYVPNGIHMPDWTPERDGARYAMPKSLEAIADHREDFSILSGLTLNGARALGDGGGDHARSVASFLTGAHPKKTDGADIRNGMSVDQLAAERIGTNTRLRSIELGMEPSAPAGRCDSGYSCVYTSNMSWRTETSPVAKEVNPQAVFDRLFGSPEEVDNARGRTNRDLYRKSILDMVSDDANSLRRELGINDQRKLDEYLYAIRQIERQLESVDLLEGEEVGAPDYPRPAGVPEAFDEHISLLMDMMVLAFQTDTTRIASLMFANAGSNRSYRQIDVNDGHHNLSHHGNSSSKQEKIATINRYHIGLFKHFLERLSEVREGDGRLIDNCMVVYGSGISDGNRHNHDDLPILLAGHGAGNLSPGRHIRFDDQTPLTNLYLTMLQNMDVRIDAFSDSTGTLSTL